MTEQKTIYQKLSAVQNELHLPKNSRNNFGGFNYRNVEQMNRTLVPLLKKHGLVSYFNHGSIQTVFEGEKLNGYIVEIMYTIAELEGGSVITWRFNGLVEPSKKGMDASQVMGSANTYATKYILQNVYMIADGSQDPDGMAPQEEELPMERFKRELSEVANTCEVPEEDVKAALAKCLSGNKTWDRTFEALAIMRTAKTIEIKEL